LSLAVADEQPHRCDGSVNLTIEVDREDDGAGLPKRWKARLASEKLP
jgi:hypothetical protein